MLSADLIVRKVTVDGVTANGLIDSGSNRTIVGPRFPIKERLYLPELSKFIVGFDGSETRVEGESTARISLAGKTNTVRVVHSRTMLAGVDLIIRMDVLHHYKVVMNLGVVTVSTAMAGSGRDPATERLSVEGPNFSASFKEGHWTARWDWKEEPILSKKVGQYAVASEIEAEFDNGVQKWINNGWLRHRQGRLGGPSVPLMAVLQATKNKVRPVLDYREVNSYVHASRAEDDVCAEKMSEWRKFPTNSSTIDIRDAYMQIRVERECSRHQTVRYKGQEYELTGMGFGLNCAPQILKAVVNKVLSVDPEIRAATSAYFDDIIIDEDQVSAARVSAHLKKYGLPCKEPAKLGTATVLGLTVRHGPGGLLWERPETVEARITPSMTRRQLFSLCGKWVGHFPVAGWLRPAASFVKRL